MPESNSGIISEALKWVWLGLLALGGYVWNALAGQVKENAVALAEHKDALSDHIMDDLKSHDDFVKRDELKELKASLTKRFDSLDQRGEEILKHLMEGVPRAEFDTSKDQLHARINDLEKRKVDK